MLQIAPHSIPEGHSEEQRKCRAGKDEALDWSAFDEGVECLLACDRNNAEIHIALSYHGVAKLQCARCLEFFEYPVSGRTDVLLQPSGPDASEDDEENGVYRYSDESEAVDFSQLLYDETITTLPLKPLCSDRCPGINYQDSEAESSSMDSRWEALKKLRDTKSNRNT